MVTQRHAALLTTFGGLAEADNQLCSFAQYDKGFPCLTSQCSEAEVREQLGVHKSRMKRLLIAIDHTTKLVGQLVATSKKLTKIVRERDQQCTP